MMDGKLYPLPETWGESSIGNAVVKTKQRDPRKKPNEVFPYVDVSAVSNTSFKITGAAPTLGSDAPSRARKSIETDDVLFATVRPTLKRIALVPPELDGAIASTGYCILRCDKAKTEPGFLYSFLITDHFNARMAVGSNDQGRIYFNGLDIYAFLDARPLELDADKGRVTLKKGLNVVIFKVINETNSWQASMRLTDKTGTPLKGVKIKLAP